MPRFRPLPDALSKADIARFWAFVERKGPDECWPWKGRPNRRGYGTIQIDGHHYKASRVAYLLQHGIDPMESLVCHRCDNPPCCNGSHIWADTPAANTADCIVKGRANTARGWRHGSKTKPQSRARGERQGNAKLTDAQVLEIRRLYSTGQYTQQQIADDFGFGIKRENVGQIVRGLYWRHLPVDAPNARNIGRYNRARPGESHSSAKLTETQVREIRQRHADQQGTQQELAVEYGVSAATISHIILRRSWMNLA